MRLSAFQFKVLQAQVELSLREQAEASEELTKCLRSLPERLQCVALYLADYWTEREIGGALGLTQAAVHRCVKRIRHELGPLQNFFPATESKPPLKCT